MARRAQVLSVWSKEVGEVELDAQVPETARGVDRPGVRRSDALERLVAAVGNGAVRVEHSPRNTSAKGEGLWRAYLEGDVGGVKLSVETPKGYRTLDAAAEWLLERIREIAPDA